MNVQKTNYTDEKVRQLQRKLYRSAKQNSKRKFHALYDKIYRMDVLHLAWKRIRANKGSGGIDNISLKDVEAYGVELFLTEIAQKLRDRTYRVSPTKRIIIPKSNGKDRPLGLPTIEDKVVQMAMKVVIEPIFETDFKPFSYGFRPKRNQHMALEEIRKACNTANWVVDADIKGYFDNINHEKLMMLLKERISDRSVLKLIKQWLKAGVMIDGVLESTEVGSPQGGVISPLLSNIYLNYLDRIWEKYGLKYGKLIRFADDSVIVCKTNEQAKEAMGLLKEVMRRLDLELNEEKTKLVLIHNGAEGFDFLGMYHRKAKLKARTGKQYYTITQVPSRKAMQKMRTTVKELFGNRSLLKCDILSMIRKINPKIQGWKNYYTMKHSWKWLKAIDWHIRKWFLRWFNAKKQIRRLRRGSTILYELLTKYNLKALAS